MWSRVPGRCATSSKIYCSTKGGRSRGVGALGGGGLILPLCATSSSRHGNNRNVPFALPASRTVKHQRGVSRLYLLSRGYDDATMPAATDTNLQIDFYCPTNYTEPPPSPAVGMKTVKSQFVPHRYFTAARLFDDPMSYAKPKLEER